MDGIGWRAGMSVCVTVCITVGVCVCICVRDAKPRTESDGTGMSVCVCVFVCICVRDAKPRTESDGAGMSVCVTVKKNQKTTEDNKLYSTYQKIIWQGNELLLIDEKQKQLRFKAEILSYRTVQKLFKSEASTCISLSIQISRRFGVFFEKISKIA